MGTQYSATSLSFIIEQINGYQVKFNSEFKNEHPNNINFGSRNVTECIMSSDFYPMIWEYFEFLNENFVGSNEHLDGIGLGLGSRIKLKDSAHQKLRHYAAREISQGRIAMIKCLNDLMGFRIIFSDVDVAEVLNVLEEKKVAGVVSRYYSREEGLYKGIHCYFKVDNKSFPWELQIWDKEWEQANLEDHARHEQEKLYNKGM